MQPWQTILALVLAATAGAEVYDGVAVSVGTHSIAQSQVDRDTRLTAFLNGSKLELSSTERRKAADRLVDQIIIREEMSKTVAGVPAFEVDGVLARIRQARFRSDAEYRRALDTYGINEAQLKAHLAWQLAVLAFVDVRFQPKQKPTSVSVAEEQANQAFFAWLDASRKHLRVQYRGGLAQ